MKSINPFVAGVFFLTVLSGCNKDPYQAALKPGQRILNENPNSQHQSPKVFAIEAPDLIECTESINCGAEIRGHVPEPGTSVVSIKGLPQGASYDASTATLTYTPGYDVVDLAAHPEQTLILMPLTVTVRSTADVVTESSRTINLLVKNKMQPVEVNVTGSSLVAEGATLQQTVEVKSADFPQGPISLSAINAPIGTELKPVVGSNNSFTVRFTPGYSFSGVGDSSNSLGYYKSVKVLYQANLPVGQPTQKDLVWTVNDVRQAPVVTAPETLVQGLDVSFSIRAEDMNGESAPRITVNPSVPFGRITATAIAETDSRGVSYPSRVMQVRWDQLRVSNLGTTTPINYEVCVQKFSNSYTVCTQKKVMVSLKADLHQAPRVDRTSWKSGELKFMRVGSPLTFTMPILDTEDMNLPVSVKLASSQPSAVTWKSGALVIQPQSEGILQFSITAESIFGQSITENFVVEVMPGNWAKAILLAGDTVQKESIDTARLAAAADLLSMKFQVSPRTLALRDAAVITTEALNSPLFVEKIQDKMMNSASSLVITSPLASKLSGKMAEEMNRFGIKFKGRMHDLLPNDDISAFTLSVDPRADIESPMVPAGLKGALTTESVNPLILDLDQMSSKCSALFRIQKRGVSLPVGAVCKYGNNRSLVVLGFEIADVLLDQQDASLLGEWMNSFTGIEGNQR